jgi:hypothetical protein
MTIQLTLFDYQELDCETRIVVQQKTEEIKVLMRRTAQDVFDIGQKLSDIKARLGHGHFMNWLKAEFEWSERTAGNFMRVYQSFKFANIADLNFSQTALYVLAAAPEDARLEAIKLAQEKAITLVEAKEIAEKHKTKSDPNSCLPNSISVAATGAAFPLPDCEAEKSDSLALRNTTKTSSKFSNNDFPMPNSVETSTHLSGASGTSDPTSSPAPLPANPSAYRETEKDQPTSETASPESLKSSTFSSPDTSFLKMFPESLAVPSDPEISPVLISENSSLDWTKAGLMLNGNVSPRQTLERPSNGKDYYFLQSPGALSSPNGTKQPGQTKLEAWLKEVGALSQKQVLNPEILEKAFALPLGWTDPWELRPGHELSATVGQDWGIVLIQELPEPQSIASSGSMPITEFKQGEKVKARKVPGLIGEVQSVIGEYVSVLWYSGEISNISVSELERSDPELKTGDRIKITGEITGKVGENLAVIRLDCGQVIEIPWSFVLPQ